MKVRKSVPEVWLRIAQRHFKAMRRPVPEAEIEFNLDTRDLSSSNSAKKFPLWFKTFEQAVKLKGAVNLQLQFQARFIHKQYSKVKNEGFIEVAENVLKGFKPLFKLLQA